MVHRSTRITNASSNVLELLLLRPPTIQRSSQIVPEPFDLSDDLFPIAPLHLRRGIFDSLGNARS